MLEQVLVLYGTLGTLFDGLFDGPTCLVLCSDVSLRTGLVDRWSTFLDAFSHVTTLVINTEAGRPTNTGAP
jgi:hypothetical protein